VSSLLFRVPQHLSWEPSLYLLYSYEVFDVISGASQTIVHTWHTDLRQCSGHQCTSCSEVSVSQCIPRIEQWIGRNWLRLNQDKKQFILIGTHQQLAKVSDAELTLPLAEVRFSTTVSDLCLMVDSQLNMADYVAHVCRFCYFQLWQLWQVWCSFTSDIVKNVKMVVHSFVRSRMSNCGSLLTGIGDCELRKLQSVQNAAARLITNTWKFDHITHVLRDLHCLSVCQGIVFKTAMLIYKCLHGLALSYLTEFCQPVSTLPVRRQLQSGAHNSPPELSASPFLIGSNSSFPCSFLL